MVSNNQNPAQNEWEVYSEYFTQRTRSKRRSQREEENKYE
jgi:hypothetical protein